MELLRRKEGAWLKSKASAKDPPDTKMLEKRWPRFGPISEKQEAAYAALLFPGGREFVATR
ncbi:hypothetical protein [Burkholderia plantarii]|uniref:hypothetical protein n=1 Tax=Burkholderia plantarii TaxID=41899 RepID=UPI000F4E0C10|nr:hypothetical protein [Burkholderia plantarii]